MSARPTFFRVQLDERGWSNWVVFCAHFKRAACDLSQELAAPELADLTVTRRAFDRWASETWRGQPPQQVAQVLERLLGFPCPQLFSPASDVVNAGAGVR